MFLKKWDLLPEQMKTDVVKPYYEAIKRKSLSLIAKRLFDLVVSFLLLVLLSPVFFIISIMIKVDSKGPVLFCQVRVTQFVRPFRIYKFRTMVENAQQLGSQVTVKQDSRITKIGHTLRKYRLDEIPQLLNILKGDMSFVGTRPEVEKYVACYTDEMYATLLLPAGVTSTASIEYKDEDQLLSDADSPDEVYVSRILPEKMNYNFDYIKNFSFFGDLKIMIQTVLAVIK
jgi:lipopolysaccharide/colanic/teichoic acid biosynthesis glycosyltransferase